MIYSWSEADPEGDDPDEVRYHFTNRGTKSLNLLGGQQEVPPDPTDLQSFEISVRNVRKYSPSIIAVRDRCYTWQKSMGTLLSIYSTQMDSYRTISARYNTQY